MRDLVQRLINQLFLLLFFSTLLGLMTIGIFFLIVSNNLNFSDAWNEVHPSVPLINDAFMRVIVSFIRSLETNMEISHYISQLISQFDYGRGYALVQTIGTLTVETIMAWSGLRLLHTRNFEMSIDDAVKAGQIPSEQTAISRNNARNERRSYLITFLLFLIITVLIWVYDFYLTYAKQVIVTEATGKTLRYAWLGPAGTVLLMLLISIGLAWLIEAIRGHILEIVSICFQFFDHPVEQNGSAVLRQGPTLMEGLMGNELPNNPQEPGQQAEQPEIMPAPLTVDTVEVHSLNGNLNVPLNELNERWRNGEIGIDGGVYAQDSADLSVTELFQILNPSEGMPVECYYTVEGIQNLDAARYEWAENRTILLRNL